MFPNPINAYEVKFMEQRELVAAMTERSRHVTASVPAHRTRSTGMVPKFVSAALDRIVMLLPDSRESLRSKEQELAAVGFTWKPDPAHDEMLARQIDAARLRRRVSYQAAQSVPPPATSSPPLNGTLATQPPAMPVHA